MSRKGKQEEREELNDESRLNYFIKLILALFLMMLIIAMIIPFYAIRLDPEPKRILAVDELKMNFTLSNQSRKIESKTDFLRFLMPENPVVKQVSALISSTACRDMNRICHAKALFYFVRDSIGYIRDPVTEEYIEYPEDVLYSKAADCDGKAVLLANMLQSVGIQTRFVFVPGHVYVQAYLPEALKKYKEKGSDAINLDPACSSCKFGEITRETRAADKVYI